MTLKMSAQSQILGNEQAAKYQTIIKFEAEEQCNERRLEIRVAGNVDLNAPDDSNEIYYDLSNKTGDIVRSNSKWLEDYKTWMPSRRRTVLTNYSIQAIS